MHRKEGVRVASEWNSRIGAPVTRPYGVYRRLIAPSPHPSYLRLCQWHGGTQPLDILCKSHCKTTATKSKMSRFSCCHTAEASRSTSYCSTCAPNPLRVPSLDIWTTTISYGPYGSNGAALVYPCARPLCLVPVRPYSNQGRVGAS